MSSRAFDTTTQPPCTHGVRRGQDLSLPHSGDDAHFIQTLAMLVLRLPVPYARPKSSTVRTLLAACAALIAASLCRLISFSAAWAAYRSIVSDLGHKLQVLPDHGNMTVPIAVCLLLQLS